MTITTLTIDQMTSIIDSYEGSDPDSGVTLTIPSEAYAVYAENNNYGSVSSEAAFTESFPEWRADAEEAYEGYFDSDAEFAKALADSMRAEDWDEDWPLTCIDWGRAAGELMHDYWANNGHYFRNI